MSVHQVKLSGPIDEDVAVDVVANILFAVKSEKLPVLLSIDSPGGDINASWAIVDTIKLYKDKVTTRCVGEAGGTALFVLASGKADDRQCLSSSHLAFSNVTASGTNVDTTKVIRALASEISDVSNLDSLEVEALMAQERSITAEDALGMGLIDVILD